MQAELKDFSQKVDKYRQVITNESQTRTVLIEPFLKILGYDVTNPFEVINEYTSDVGTKKGEKVDYAIQLKDELVLIIEAKDCNVSLNEKTISQLFRYYSTSHCRIALLTNGVDYWFFSDTNRQNIMDTTPFYKFNILEYTLEDVMFLDKITKKNFDLNTIHTVSKTYSFRKAFKEYLYTQVENPSNDFTSFIMETLGMKNFNSADSPQLVAYELGRLLGVDGLTEPELSEMQNVQKKVAKSVVQKVAPKDPNDRLKGVLTFDAILNASEPTLGKPTELVINGESFGISAWVDVMLTIVDYVYKSTGDMASLILADGNPDNVGWLSSTPDHMHLSKVVVTSGGVIHVEVKASARLIASRTKKLLDYAKIPYDKVQLTLI